MPPSRPCGAATADRQGRVVGRCRRRRDCRKAVTAARLDALQLHGGETPERVGAAQGRLRRPGVEGLAVAAPGDVEKAGALPRRRRPDPVRRQDAERRASRRHGPHAFDWSLLAAYRAALPWGLAGGLTRPMWRKAIGTTGAPLVDTSSGVESAPGVKDVDKITAFCKRLADDRAQTPQLASATSPTSAAISASSAGATSPKR